jgi:hypothetical protein
MVSANSSDSEKLLFLRDKLFRLLNESQIKDDGTEHCVSVSVHYAHWLMADMRELLGCDISKSWENEL